MLLCAYRSTDSNLVGAREECEGVRSFLVGLYHTLVLTISNEMNLEWCLCIHIFFVKFSVSGLKCHVIIYV